MATPYNVVSNRFNNKTLGNTPTYFNKINNKYRYFSGCDAEFYFGDIYIDETTSFQYQLIENNMPLFGYNSFLYDEVAKGNRYVQGAFGLNYTEEGYLVKIINELSNGATKSSNQFGENSHNPLYNSGFNILISLGQGKQDIDSSSILVLEDIHIMSNGLSIEPDGGNIIDTYTFIARDVKTANNIKIDSESINSNNSTLAADNKSKYPNSISEIGITNITYSEDGESGEIGIFNITYGTEEMIDKITNIMLLKPSIGKYSEGLYNISSKLPQSVVIGEEYKLKVNTYVKETGLKKFEIDILIDYKSEGKSKNITLRKTVDINISN